MGRNGMEAIVPHGVKSQLTFGIRLQSADTIQQLQKRSFRFRANANAKPNHFDSRYLKCDAK
eukprot:scaffold8381_cov98-Cylindrotheca_fusiformis.AAC.1